MSRNFAGWLLIVIALAFYGLAWCAHGAWESVEWYDEDIEFHWYTATSCGLLCAFAGIAAIGGKGWTMVAAVGLTLAVLVLEIDGPPGVMARASRLSWRVVWITLGTPLIAVILDWLERRDIRTCGEVKE